MAATVDLTLPAAAETTGLEQPQHMRALLRANEVRKARAAIKWEISRGERSIESVIMECPSEMSSCTMGDLLMAQHRWGLTRMRKFLAQIPLSEKKTLGSLTERQQCVLIAMLQVGSRR